MARAVETNCEPAVTDAHRYILVPARGMLWPSMDPNMKGPQLTVRNQDRFINWNEYTTGRGCGLQGRPFLHGGQRPVRNPLYSLLILLYVIAL